MIRSIFLTTETEGTEKSNNGFVSYRENVLNNLELQIAKHRQNIENSLTERLGALCELCASVVIFLISPLFQFRGFYGQTSDSLTCNRKNGIPQGRRNGRHARLSNSAGGVLILNDMHFHLGHFAHAQ